MAVSGIGEHTSLLADTNWYWYGSNPRAGPAASALRTSAPCSRSGPAHDPQEVDGGSSRWSHGPEETGGNYLQLLLESCTHKPIQTYLSINSFLALFDRTLIGAAGGAREVERVDWFQEGCWLDSRPLLAECRGVPV